MWDEEKQRHFDALRRHQVQRALTSEEQQQLDYFLYDLEQEEWIRLRPALDRLREEQKHLRIEVSQIHSQNAILAALAERYADLLARARVQLDVLVSERNSLHSEYERARR